MVRFWLQHLVKLVGGYPAAALAPGCWARLMPAAARMLGQLAGAARSVLTLLRLTSSIGTLTNSSLRAYGCPCASQLAHSVPILVVATITTT